MIDQPLFERHFNETRHVFETSAEASRKLSVDLQHQSASQLEIDQVSESDQTLQQASEARRQFREIGAFISEDLPLLYEEFSANVAAALSRRDIVLSLFSTVPEEDSRLRSSPFDFQTEPTLQQLGLIKKAFGDQANFAFSDEENLTPIDILALSNRSKNALTRRRLHTVGRLVTLEDGPESLRNIGQKGETEILTQMFHFGVVPIQMRGSNPTQLPLDKIRPEIWTAVSLYEQAYQIADLMGQPEKLDLSSQISELQLITYSDATTIKALESSGLQTVADLLILDRSTAENRYKLWGLIDSVTADLALKGVHPKGYTKVFLPHGGYLYKPSSSL